MRKLSLAFGAVATVVTLAMTVAASALPITLTLSGPITGNTVGPQSASNPCVICANGTNPPTFGYNNYKESGSISSYDMYSTTPTDQIADGVQGTPYTVGQIQGPSGVMGTGPFDVAIDVNTTNAAGETLEKFEVIDTTTNTVLYNYTTPTVIGNVNNNGNGWADWTLGTIDLTGLGLPSTDGILFHAFWDNASDGAESYFLVRHVPEP